MGRPAGGKIEMSLNRRIGKGFAGNKGTREQGQTMAGQEEIEEKIRAEEEEV